MQKPWQMAGAVLLLGAGLFLGGCSPKPRAPALIQGEPVYENPQEGFRFLPPPNWMMNSRAEIPSGKIEKERLLVSYKRMGPRLAAIDLTVAEAPTSGDLAAVLDGYGTARQGWEGPGPPESIRVAGLNAVRLSYRMSTAPEVLIREIVGVQKQQRLFVFTCIYPQADSKARDQLRKAVESMTW